VNRVNARLRYAAIAFLIASVPFTLMVIAFRSEGERGQPPEPLARVVALGAAEWYTWVLVTPFIDARVRRARPTNTAGRVRVLGGHVVLWMGFVLVHGTVVSVAAAAMNPAESRRFSDRLVGRLLPDAILYAAITAAFTVAEQRRRQTEVAERLRAEVAEARLDALRQQLNPHFLFNTLNHIVVQLRSGESGPAQQMLLSLSDLLRDVLRERAQLIPLRDEVRMVERYLEIERARFGDRLQAEVTFEPRALDALVPSLILQPLLENAMRHGVSAADGHCRLSLVARTNGERLAITVRDAGPGLDPARAGDAPGIGLRNTGERLRYLYGADHSFDLRPLDGGGLLVSLDLPFRRA